MSALQKPSSGSDLSTTARAFLAARGLDPELCAEIGLTSGHARDGAECIKIPYERGGAFVSAKYRKVSEKGFFQLPAGAPQNFWRVDCIADAGLADQPLIITEGEFDAIAAIQCGYWRTVSVPGGAPAKPHENVQEARSSARFAFIEAAHDALESVKEIIIASDGDANGVALLSDLTALLGPARCRFVAYPPGCKDLNDVLVKHGEEGVRAAIDGAKWCRVHGVHRFLDLPPLPPLHIWRPNVHQPIDDLITICPGQVSVWTGIPGHGKSSLLNACVWSIALKDGVRIAHGAFESAPQREYFEDAIGFVTGSPAHMATAQERDEVRAFLQEHVTFLVSDGYVGPGEEEFFDADLKWFLEASRTAVVRHGCRIVILDPWSQIEHSHGASESETVYVQRSLRMLRSFARTFDVHVAIVAHPTKQRKLDNGTYAMPEGYEISGSAHWFNGVDLGVTIHRDPPLMEQDGEMVPDMRSPRVLIRVWKKKNHRVMGKPGDAYASFSSATNRYHPAEHWEERTFPKSYGAGLRDGGEQ